MVRKRSKLKKNTLAESILLFLKAFPFTFYNHKQIAHALGINDKEGRIILLKHLEDLVLKNVLKQVRRGKYSLSNSYFQDQNPRRTVTGIVDMKQTGKAYVITDRPGEDIFVSAGNTNHALHGDKVSVLLFPQRKGRKTEGQIVEIITRSKKQFVGIIEITKFMAFLKPDNTSIPLDIIIPKEKLHGARNGLKRG